MWRRSTGRPSGISIALASLGLVGSVLAPLPPLPAQPVRKPLRVLTTKDGLPQSFVSGMAQDAAGFVWVATRNGLARYDGRQFNAFHYRRGDTTTLSSEVIISLATDTHNQIWIEHESGEIDCLSPRTQHLERIRRRPLFARHPMPFARRGWTVDTQGNLWGTQLKGGLWAYHWAQGTLRHYTKRQHGLPSDTIRGLLASQKGPLWLLSRQALSRFSPATGKSSSHRLPLPIPVDALPAEAEGTLPLHERPNGELMWTQGGQLLVFSPTTGRFRQHGFPSPNQTWFQTAPDGQDYLITRNRLYRYDSVQGPVWVGEVSGATAESILVDQAGLVWVGTNAGGIHQLDLRGPYFEQQPNQLGFFPDLFGQRFGISLAQRFDWPLTESRFGELSYNVRATLDAHNRLWVGLRYRAGYVDPIHHRLVSLPPIPTAKATRDRQLGIMALRFDPQGRLWTVDNDGYVAYFDARRRAWQRWLSADSLRQQVAPRLTPQDIVVDQNAIWITDHRYGLIRIERATKQIRVMNQATPGAPLLTDMLLGLQPDPTRANRLWIGSHAGLISLDKTTLRGRTFTTADGLPDNTIYSVLADRRGYLWLSTNQGLCRFDPRSHQVRSFNTTDGLPGDEFNRFHHLALPDGRLAFGGTQGGVLFDPRTIGDDGFAPPLALTELKLNNRSIPLTPGRGILPVPLNELRELAVPFEQNTFSVSFAGLQYNQPARLQYQYQLVGYDQTWVDAGRVPLAAYTQVPPGQYTLRVRATNTTGQWSPHGHSLRIRVRPPWWRTSWAYGTYLLLGFSLLRAYLRLRSQRERGEQQAAQLREVNQIKEQFFANVTHELRTPLTLILSPVETLLSELQGTPYHQRLSLVERNARHLLGLINQLLELARLDARQVKLAPVPGRPDAVVSQLLDQFAPAASAAHIELIYHGQGSGWYWFDPDHLERIVTNLVANALRFTPGTPDRSGRVSVSLQLKADLELMVSDTGIGIAAHHLPRLFERFYQVETPAGRPPAGTGLGLALVRELVELQGGCIRVESQPGQGTTFRLSLPYPPVRGGRRGCAEPGPAGREAAGAGGRAAPGRRGRVAGGGRQRRDGPVYRPVPVTALSGLPSGGRAGGAGRGPPADARPDHQ